MSEMHSDEKLKRICDALRVETLKPAEEEAAALIQRAKADAERILAEAKTEAESIVKRAQDQAQENIEKGKAALCLAGKRVIEALKHAVEKNLFRENLSEWLTSILSTEKVSAELLSVLVGAVEREGVSGHLTGYISKKLSARSVNEVLGKTITDKMKNKGVVLGDFIGGVKLKVNDKHWVLDLSAEALVELFTRYLQKDFREMIFAEGAEVTVEENS